MADWYNKQRKNQLEELASRLTDIHPAFGFMRGASVGIVFKAFADASDYIPDLQAMRSTQYGMRSTGQEWKPKDYVSYFDIASDQEYSRCVEVARKQTFEGIGQAHMVRIMKEELEQNSEHYQDREREREQEKERIAEAWKAEQQEKARQVALELEINQAESDAARIVAMETTASTEGWAEW